ncbi:hypothetical protein GCM10012278_63620 [Nonomuraea glycinis]|uniref:Uncharacterized protein n=1 Tax=Nonomuraea glycinis TaxID=2047744 RepID=A0A918E8N5_9ACTN|nr:hypothetical protein GCM10012278_63620 [Nonomuraea glycinis]
MIGAEPQVGAAETGDVPVAWGCGLLAPGAAQAAASAPMAITTATPDLPG